MKGIKVDDFFGIPIYTSGKGKFECYADFQGQHIVGDFPDDVKNKIMAVERAKKRKNIIERLQSLDMSESAAEFVVNMITDHHSTESAALMRIGDYLSAHGH